MIELSTWGDKEAEQDCGAEGLLQLEQLHPGQEGLSQACRRCPRPRRGLMTRMLPTVVVCSEQCCVWAGDGLPEVQQQTV